MSDEPVVQVGHGRTGWWGVLVASCAALVVVSVTVSTPGPVRADEPTETGGTPRTVLLLDASGSMAEAAGGGQTKIQAAKKALRTVVGDLPDDAQVGLRVFGSEVFSRGDKGACTDSVQVAGPATGNRAELLAGIDRYRPFGETPIPHALRQAALDLGSEGPRSILLVSDGESTCQPDPCEVAGELAKNGIDLQINVVGLSVSGPARDQLRCIADRGQGSYYDADSAAEIEEQLVRVASRAVQPFAITGTPIRGGTEEQPTPLTTGDWVDSIEPGEEKFFTFERTVAGSTLRVSATSQGENETNQDLGIRVKAPDGSECGDTLVQRLLNTKSLAGVGSSTEWTEGCDQPGGYLVQVRRGTIGENAVPVGIRVREEPPVQDPGPATSTELDVSGPVEVSGAPQEVAGAPTFEAAPQIGAGRWRSTVVPGEMLLYRLPLEPGQSVQLQVAFDKGPAEHWRPFAPLGTINVFDPMRADQPRADDAVTTSRVDKDPLRTGIRAIARGVGTDSFSGGTFELAGDHYVAISVRAEEETVVLPFTLSVQVDGEPVAGPTYADGREWDVTDTDPVTESDQADENRDEPADEPSDENSTDGPDGAGSGLPVWAWVVGGAGAAALFLVGLVGFLLGRSRRR